MFGAQQSTISTGARPADLCRGSAKGEEQLEITIGTRCKNDLSCAWRSISRRYYKERSLTCHREESGITSLLLLCAAGVFSSGCRTGDDNERLEADIAAIRAFLEGAGDMVSAGDVEAEVNRFTEDGIYMWPDAPSIQGHAALRTWFEERFEQVEVKLENETWSRWLVEDRASNPQPGSSVNPVLLSLIHI